jgi:two-component system, LuxR family, sensor kinase FixL
MMQQVDPTQVASQSTDDCALSVLIVDDDEGMRRSVRRVLLLDGYQVDTVGNAAELRQKENLDQFFAILLDRKLPDADGSELLEELKLHAPQASILIVTGYADMESTIKAIRTGVHDYLIKPVEPETLRNRLSTLAEFYRVRRELERSERRMLFLVEHLPAGAVYIAGQQLFGNKTLEHITGYSTNEIGTIDQWFSVLCRGHADQCVEIYQENRRQKFKSAFRLLITRKDGVRRTLEIAGYRYDPHEIWLVTDITELQDAQERLVQSERLAAIGQMVTGLAHESRNALQRARGCLDLLELDLQSDPEQLDLTQRIRRSLNDLQRNYEEVRNYAAPIVLELTTCSLAELLQQPFDDLRCEFHNDAHQLRIDQQLRHPQARIDAHRIKQMFRNIYENAIAASNDAACVDARLTEVQHNGREFYRIEIRDHGHGIDPDVHARMFEPFFTTKQSGTGLGMAICKRIVDAHGGTIETENAPDGGAIVRIELPRL